MLTKPRQLTPGYSIKTVYRKDAIYTSSFFLQIPSTSSSQLIYPGGGAYMNSQYVLVIIQWKQRLQSNNTRLSRVFTLNTCTCIIRTYSDNYTCKWNTTWVYNNKKYNHICVRELIKEHTTCTRILVFLYYNRWI